MTASTRREFLKTAALAGLGASLMPFAGARGMVERETVRLGIVGVGARGTSHLRGMLNRNDVIVQAVCDVDDDNLARAERLVEEAGQDPPAAYGDNERSWEELVARDDLDGVIVSTPWRWHTPVALAAMEDGKYVGVEVPSALSIEDCWRLVRTSEATGMPCMMLENVCYRRDVMAVLRLAREGVLGTLLHARCGYRHDLRAYLFNEELEFGPGTGSVSSWRTRHYVHRNADLYPTHGLGPVAHWLDINRGNRFLTITSAATKSAGLQEHLERNTEPGHPFHEQTFQQGDIVTSTLTTANGETVIVTHDTSVPRPYSLDFQLQGTQGLWLNDAGGIHVEGRSEPHQWDDFEAYQDEYDAELWQRYEEEALGSGHGGMDFFVRHAFVESIKREVQTLIDVYDLATWASIGPLSEASIAQGGRPIEVPDFTRGRWLDEQRAHFLRAQRVLIV